MRVRVCALNLWTDIYIYIYIPEERSSKCLIRTTESTPISHEDVNQWVTILQTEKSRHHEYHFNQSQDPSHQEMVLLASPDIGYKMIQMLEIKSINLTNSNSVRFSSDAKLLSPFLSGNDWKILIHWDGKQVYIYIHIYSCFGNKNPAVLGDIQLNGGRWWLDSLSLLDPVTMNERLLSWKRLMSPSPWTHILSVGCFRGVFLACTSINIISNTPEATPPNQLNGFVPRLLFSFLVHLLEDVRILENIREHHPMPRFASKPMARKYITIHLRNIYLKSYIIWPIFHKLFSFSKATWSRPFFPHEMHLKPHLTTSNNTKPSPYYPYTIHPIQWHFQFGNATTAVR